VFLLLVGIFFNAVDIASGKGQPEAIFVGLEGEELAYRKKIQLSCDLLGIKVKEHFVGNNAAGICRARFVPDDAEVIIVTARALEHLDQDLAAWFKNCGRKAKMLIMAIHPTTDRDLLKKWSGGMIGACRLSHIETPAASVRVAEGNNISLELAGVEYPIAGKGARSVAGFELVDPEKVTVLMVVRNGDGKDVCPVFVEWSKAERSVFFLSSTGAVLNREDGPGTTVGGENLSNIVPTLMFLKHAFGDRCWHGLKDHANLTIDDPWLREPYGHLSFGGLCNEAKKANFHATIGFIPYNYDRSEENVIATFHKCKENLSLSIHGNNHDFREFERAGDHHGDEMRILQALERMNIFRRKTGIPYDRVMVFPRGVFTSDSLRLLKEHNFIMTVNATSGPVDVSNPKSDVDEIRGVNLDVGNFPMIKRMMLPQSGIDRPVQMSLKSWIAMRLFLDLPVILAAHHDYFRKGMDAFNPVADFINRTQPVVEWASLGEIGRRLYLQRRIDEQEIEVQAFSSQVMIRNSYPFEMKFKVRKKEDFSIPIEAVKVDGQNHEYHREAGHIRVDIRIAPGSERSVEILYGHKPQGVLIDVSQADLQATIIRFLSDFRDNTLSRSSFTEKAVLLFYGLGGVKGASLVALGMIGSGIVVFILHIRGRKRGRHTNRSS